MTVHVSNPAFVHDLLASLKRANYLASQTGELTVEVSDPPAASAEQARLHLGFYLANWRARHPGIVADIVTHPLRRIGGACAPPSITELGGLPVIGEAPDPVRGTGDALIRIEAVPLNPIDINVGAGRFYGGTPPLPYIPGGEGVGRVVEAEALAPGTLVWAHGAGMGTRRDGALAELLSVPEDVLVPLPGRRRSGARRSARDRGSGRLAPCCLPGARARRATPCSCSARPGRSGSWRCRARGSSGAGRGWSPRVGGRKRWSGRGGWARMRSCPWRRRIWSPRSARPAAATGPSYVIDPLWGEPAVAAATAAAPGARIVNIGQSAGPAAPFLSADVRGKQLSILGFSNFATPREVLRREYLRLVELAQEGRSRSRSRRSRSTAPPRPGSVRPTGPASRS